MKYEDTIYYGNNLDWMKKIEPESIDLVYIDPPFCSNDDKKGFLSNKTEIRFVDTWQGIESYIETMIPRIEIIYNILKKKGSFYLHCDWHADAYLRVRCDKLFGKLTAEIIWNRTGTHNDSKTYGKVHDTILFYQKSNNSVFNKQYKPYTDHVFDGEDERGKFRKDRLDARGLYGGGYEYEWKGIIDIWRRPIESMKKLDEQGLIHYSTSGRPYKKVYDKDIKGIPISDLWDDISLEREEITGFPTQKPKSLLERIIKTSSNEGDIVLDAYCGTGTTLVVAKRLKRHYIGIDADLNACKISATRLGIPYERIKGIDLSKENILEMEGYEFQHFICDRMNAVCYKKSKDKGIDGMTNITNYPLQIKKSSVGRQVISLFLTDMKRLNKKTGIVIGLEFSKDAKEEKSRIFNDERVTIKLYTLEDILEGKQFKENVSIEPDFKKILPIKQEPLFKFLKVI